jgi:cobalt-zinc-cadmium resistance protein CzcA
MQLQEVLKTNNRSDGAGRLQENEENWLLRADGDVRSLDDLRSVVVTEREGRVVRVGDVAQVRIGALTRYGMVTKDGKGEAVEGLVIGLRGANAQQLVTLVRERLAEVQKTLPEGMVVKAFYDRGNLVERAISTVVHALGEASVLVVVLLFLFLGNLRAALAVVLILPLASLATFIAMRVFGLSANLMSLGGLAIAIGMLVDAAVVVVENVEAHQAEGGNMRGMPRLHLIYRAAAEVAVPVTSGIAVIVIVFLPLLSLQGLEGKLFGPVALTIVFALISSLILSLTVIPVATSFLLADHHTDPPRLVTWLEARYAAILGWTLNHEKPVYATSLAALVAAGVMFALVGKSFMPSMDEGDLVIQHEKVPSIGLAKSAATDIEIQRRIMANVPEVESMISRVGSDELGLDPMGTNETDGFAKLKPRESWRKRDKAWVIDQVRAVTNGFAGVNTSFTQPIDMRVSELISGTRGDLAIKIYGADLDKLNDLARRVVTVLGAIKGSEDVTAGQNDGVQYLQIKIDRVAAGRAGLSVEAVQDDLRALVEGKSTGVVIEQGRRLPLLIRGGDALNASPESFGQLRLPLANGVALPLSQLAQLVPTEGPVRVDRENSARMAVIRANVRGRDLVGFVAEAKAAVAREIPLPSGYRMTWGGQFENQQRTAARLAVVVPIALGLIFLLLFATFGSVRQATLVFVNIPFAMIGGVFALAITGEYLSVPASVGFIALMGIAVLNGLVMISYFNQLRARGLAVAEVVAQGARRRLRPVLMTASITAFGLVPLLFATGPGSEIQRPLAIVVIGGLLSSTALTLVLLPSLFRRFGMRT